MQQKHKEWAGMLAMGMAMSVAGQLGIDALHGTKESLQNINQIPDIVERLGKVEKNVAELTDAVKGRNYAQRPREHNNTYNFTPYPDDTAENKTPGPWLTKPGS